MTPAPSALKVSAVPGAGLPPELMLALVPRESTVSARSVWLRRVLALGGAGIVTTLIMGPCMRT